MKFMCITEIDESIIIRYVKINIFLKQKSHNSATTKGKIVKIWKVQYFHQSLVVYKFCEIQLFRFEKNPSAL
jgi:hypothetical protein